MNEDTQNPNIPLLPQSPEKVDEGEEYTTREPSGGQGAEYPPHIRQDQKLVRQALKNDWPISPDLRKFVLKDMICQLRSSSMRVRQNAIKAILAADNVNVKREGHEIRRAALETLSAALVTPEALERQEEALKALLIDVKLPTE